MKAIDMTNEIQMEKYLRKILSIKGGSKKDLTLNRFYESLLNMEKGFSFIKNKDAQNFNKKVVRIFIEALKKIETITGKKDEISILRFQINSAVKDNSLSSDVFLALFKAMKVIYNPL